MAIPGASNILVPRAMRELLRNVHGRLLSNLRGKSFGGTLKNDVEHLDNIVALQSTTTDFRCSSNLVTCLYP